MKYIFIVLCIITAVTISHGQTFQWVNGMGGTQNDEGTSIALDSFGHVYTTGVFRNTVDFNSGPAVDTATSLGGMDIFIMKYDTLGNFIWVKSFGGISAEYVHSICVDQFGAIYITGLYTGTVDLDPGPNVYFVSSAGGSDMFITKFDSSGNFLWAGTIGGQNDDEAFSIVSDQIGNIFVTGEFIQDTVDFDPGIGVQNLVALVGEDAFVLNLDYNGNFVWVKQIAGNGSQSGKSIHIDISGNIIITGYFNGDTDFDPGLGVNIVYSAGSKDVFVLKLSNFGNLIWIKTTGGLYPDAGRSVTTDKVGSIYLTGEFQYDSDLDPGLGTFNLTSSGLIDIYILKLDSNGIFKWAKGFGDYAIDESSQIVSDDNGNTYTSGYYTDTVNFDPGISNFYQYSKGGSCDGFILKLDSSGNFSWVESFGGLFYDNGNALAISKSGRIYTTGTFSDTADFDPGPSIFNLVSNGWGDIFNSVYEVCGSNYSLFYTSCDSFVYGGVSYDSTTTITNLYSTVNGCDSNVSVNIIINFANSHTITQFSCNSFTLNGITYNTSGTYIQTLLNALNCDSVITLSLTINSSNTTVTQAGATLTANATGATYQWLTCSPFQEVIGETNQTFDATANGSYAVVVTDNGCTDTSLCFTVSGMRVKDYSTSSNIQLYPNPITKKLFIEAEIPFQNATIVVSNIVGQKVSEYINISSSKFEIDMSKFLSGSYFVKISDEALTYVRVITKE